MASIPVKVNEPKDFALHILRFINPVREPSLVVALVLTFVEEAGTGDPFYKILLFIILNWIAVKAIVWLLVNFSMASIYLGKKVWWCLRNPQLAWRMLDAVGTEDIIIGAVTPESIFSQDPILQSLAKLKDMDEVLAAINAQNVENSEFSGSHELSKEQAEKIEAFSQAFAAYNRLIAEWADFTEDKWRAISDSQLGWKSLRGRWGSWDDIYKDSYGIAEESENIAEFNGDATSRRFEAARERGSAAASVACFLRDVAILRQNLSMINLDIPSEEITVDQDSSPKVQVNAQKHL